MTNEPKQRVKRVSDERIGKMRRNIGLLREVSSSAADTVLGLLDDYDDARALRDAAYKEHRIHIKALAMHNGIDCDCDLCEYFRNDAAAPEEQAPGDFEQKYNALRDAVEDAIRYMRVRRPVGDVIKYLRKLLNDAAEPEAQVPGDQYNVLREAVRKLVDKYNWTHEIDYDLFFALKKIYFNNGAAGGGPGATDCEGLGQSRDSTRPDRTAPASDLLLVKVKDGALWKAAYSGWINKWSPVCPAIDAPILRAWEKYKAEYEDDPQAIVRVPDGTLLRFESVTCEECEGRGGFGIGKPPERPCSTCGDPNVFGSGTGHVERLVPEPPACETCVDGKVPRTTRHGNGELDVTIHPETDACPDCGGKPKQGHGDEHYGSAAD